MNLLARYKMLTLWPKIGVWGSIASVIALFIVIVQLFFTSSPSNLIKNEGIINKDTTVNVTGTNQTIIIGSTPRKDEDKADNDASKSPADPHEVKSGKHENNFSSMKPSDMISPSKKGAISILTPITNEIIKIPASGSLEVRGEILNISFNELQKMRTYVEVRMVTAVPYNEYYAISSISENMIWKVSYNKLPIVNSEVKLSASIKDRQNKSLASTTLNFTLKKED